MTVEDARERLWGKTVALHKAGHAGDAIEAWDEARDALIAAAREEGARGVLNNGGALAAMMNAALADVRRDEREKCALMLEERASGLEKTRAAAGGGGGTPFIEPHHLQLAADYLRREAILWPDDDATQPNEDEP